MCIRDRYGAHLGIVTIAGDVAVGGGTLRLVNGAGDAARTAKRSPLAENSKVTKVLAKSLDEQVGAVSDAIPGLGREQAKVLLEAARARGTGVVFGGSRVSSHFGRGAFKPTSDLDIGFTEPLKTKHVKKILNKFDNAGPLKSERGIKITPENPKIATPEEFFQRSGVRYKLDSKTFFGPSGSITAYPDGRVTFISPQDIDFRISPKY